MNCGLSPSCTDMQLTQEVFLLWHQHKVEVQEFMRDEFMLAFCMTEQVRVEEHW